MADSAPEEMTLKGVTEVNKTGYKVNCVSHEYTFGVAGFHDLIAIGMCLATWMFGMCLAVWMWSVWMYGAC